MRVKLPSTQGFDYRGRIRSMSMSINSSSMAISYSMSLWESISIACPMYASFFARSFMFLLPKSICSLSLFRFPERRDAVLSSLFHSPVFSQ
jgi:hypothetical protein